MSLNGHATVVVGHVIVGLTVKQRFLDVSSIKKTFCKNSPKGHADSGRWSRDCRPTVKHIYACI